MPSVAPAGYYEKRYRRHLERVKAEIPEGDRELVLKFDESLTAEGISAARKSIYLRQLVVLRGALGKPFKKVTKEDVKRALAETSRRGVSKTTVQGFKITFKRFYKWLLGDDEEYPQQVKWIKTTPQNNKKLPRDSLLTKEDIEKLAQAADNPRDRAIILVLAESGIRAGELLSLQVGHVRFDKYGALLTVSGKTGDRAVRLIAAAPALATWLENHPDRANPKAPLWTCIGVKNHGKGMSYPALQGVVRKLKQRSGLKKRVHLHGFRHTAATRLAQHFTEAEMDTYLGWVPGSRMPSIYTHLSSRDVDRAMRRMHGLVTEEEEEGEKFTAIRCPRCGQSNSPGSEFCSKCSLPLSLEAVRREERKREIREGLVEKVKESPKFREIQALLEELVKEAT